MKEDCKPIGKETCTKTRGKCKYTCCQYDLCNNDSLARSLDALKCYHCEGTDGSHVFHHSTPPTVHRLFRHVLYSDTTIEVERRLCISDEESSALHSVCNRAEHKLANETSWCRVYLCERDLCNLASCVHLAPFFIAFSNMFGMITMR